ncbi:MAG: trypsin-like peptidase domain-containing protein [Candidatus Riflebacteria bacterium]|nr:trypsin-like peptidase domain-containing protein [Candidatus Riflebacteria bacterium]
MSEIEDVEVKTGLWYWIVADIVLICGVVIWLLVNEPSSKVFQNTYGAPPGNSNNAGAPLQGLQVALPVNMPPTPAARPVDGVTRPTPRVVSFNKTLLAIAPSIVTIVTEGVQAQGGSGVIVSSQGYIVTNRHVIDGARTIKVILPPAQGSREFPAALIDFNEEFDLALVKITPDLILVPAPLGNSDKALVGDNILVMGSPFGLSQSASSGIISYINRTLSTRNRIFHGLIQTDAPLNLGSSGGALVNTNAEVIGINVAILSMTQSYSGIGFAIPVNKVKELFGSYIDSTPRQKKPDLAPNWIGVAIPGAKNKGQVWLGIEVSNIDENITQQMRLPFDQGVLIDSVLDKSIAEKAGLMSGDVIYRVNDRLIKDDVMLWEYLIELGVDTNPKQDVKFTIFRQGVKTDLLLEMEPLKGFVRPNPTVGGFAGF